MLLRFQHALPMSKRLIAPALALAGMMMATQCFAQASIPLPKPPVPKGSQASEPEKEPPLLGPAPKEAAKEVKLGPAACEALSEAWTVWLRDSILAIEGQTLKPGPKDRAREGAASLWEGFRRAREVGFNVDALGAKVEAVYLGTYAPGPFAPLTPFERFKEPRRACVKKGPLPSAAVKKA